MEENIWIAGKIVGNPVSNQMRLTTALRQILRKRMIRPVHAAGFYEVSGDYKVRLHRTRIRPGRGWPLERATANRIALSIQNSIPLWLPKKGVSRQVVKAPTSYAQITAARIANSGSIRLSDSRNANKVATAIAYR